jgi:hypothetical protein
VPDDLESPHGVLQRGAEGLSRLLLHHGRHPGFREVFVELDDVQGAQVFEAHPAKMGNLCRKSGLRRRQPGLQVFLDRDPRGIEATVRLVIQEPPELFLRLRLCVPVGGQALPLARAVVSGTDRGDPEAVCPLEDAAFSASASLAPLLALL